jgi:hypothetical protein
LEAEDANGSGPDYLAVASLSRHIDAECGTNLELWTFMAEQGIQLEGAFTLGDNLVPDGRDLVEVFCLMIPLDLCPPRFIIHEASFTYFMLLLMLRPLLRYGWASKPAALRNPLRNPLHNPFRDPHAEPCPFSEP